jgi:DNA-binding transcriptional LysR family regulator
MSAGERRDPWLGIELRHLAALSAIEREGTFSEAALALGYVQSAISGQVATLERLTGTCLVERSRTPAPQQLTPAGELLLSHFGAMLEELELARERIESARQQETDRFRVGVADRLADSWVGSALAAVAADRHGPHVTSVETLDPAALEHRLTAGEVDLALVDLPFVAEGVATAEITRDWLTLVVQAGSPLDRRVRLRPHGTLGAIPLIAWCEQMEPSRIELELAELGLASNVLIRADGLEVVQDLVAAGLGAAILPRGAVRRDSRLAVHELEPGLPARVAGIAWARERSSEQGLRRVVDVVCQLRDADADGDEPLPPTRGVRLRPLADAPLQAAT